MNLPFLVHAIEYGNICRDVDFEISDDIVLTAYIAGCASVVAYVETYMTKVPMHTNIQTRYEWVLYTLNGNEKKCHNAFRMSSHVFRQFCNILHTQYGYDGTKRVCLEESIAMTLVILGNAIGNRMVQDRFQHSGETVHWHVAMVVTLLTTIMATNIIKLADPTFCNVPSHIRSSDLYLPHFKVLCEFGILTWFYSIYLYGHTTYFISHGIFVAIVRVALVRLMGFMFPWSY